MRQSKKKGNRRRQEEEEVPGISNWSELCPDLLRCVFKRLSFTTLNRAKSVCSSWHSASRGCVPNQNQIPWLILFPPNSNNNNNNNSSSCVLFVPEDQDKVYRSRDLGVEFAQSRCLMTCGSWLLLLNPLLDLYILNPLTGERFDLPDTQYFSGYITYDRACFWIDNKTKDYLVVMLQCSVFTKKGDNKWHDLPLLECYKDFVYNHKDQKLYVHYLNGLVNIWDFSGDNPRKDESVSLHGLYFNHYDFPSFLNEKDDELYWKKLHDFKTRIAVTVSGGILRVSSIVQHCKTWYFRIYKRNQVDGRWVKIESLGDEALIYDMGITVITNGISGIKRNSIYFSGVDHGRDDPHHIFVYDLTTQKMEPLPQCVLSSIPFSDARWFFPC